MVEYGLQVKAGHGMTRVQLECAHQNGLLYVVPAEKSWVCTQEHMPAHALAGLFGDLDEMGDPRIAEIMQRWGVYFRRLPLDDGSED